MAASPDGAADSAIDVERCQLEKDETAMVKGYCNDGGVDDGSRCFVDFMSNGLVERVLQKK